MINKPKQIDLVSRFWSLICVLLQEIRKNFKKFAQQFEIEDISKKQSASKVF